MFSLPLGMYSQIVGPLPPGSQSAYITIYHHISSCIMIYHHISPYIIIIYYHRSPPGHGPLILGSMWPASRPASSYQPISQPASHHQASRSMDHISSYIIIIISPYIITYHHVSSSYIIIYHHISSSYSIIDPHLGMVP